jgi:hypothetical protein
VKNLCVVTVVLHDQLLLATSSIVLMVALMCDRTSKDSAMRATIGSA